MGVWADLGSNDAQRKAKHEELLRAGHDKYSDYEAFERISALLMQAAGESDDQPFLAILENPWHVAWAVEHGYEPVVRRLLQAGLDVRNMGEDSPLTQAFCKAAGSGHAGVLTALLDAGFPIDTPEGYGSAFDSALSWGQLGVAEMLLDRGMRPSARNTSALHQAAAKGATSIVRKLLALGTPVNTIDGMSLTPLMQAAKHGHVEVVRVLLAAGAAVNATSQTPSDEVELLQSLAQRAGQAGMRAAQEAISGMSLRSEMHTALIMAVVEGHSSVVAELLVAGADPLARNGMGQTAYDVAAPRGHSAIVDLLRAAGGIEPKREAQARLFAAAAAGDVAAIGDALAVGADINAIQKVHGRIDPDKLPRDTEHGGTTALMEACLHGHPEAVRRLLAAGADIKLYSEGGYRPKRTALHWAAFSGSGECIELLLDAGADMYAEQIEWGKPAGTALQVAAAANKVEAIEVLLRRGMKIADAKQAAALLMSCAERGSTAAAQALIATGVDVNVKAKDGSTALIVAAGKGQARMVKLLLEAAANPRAKRKQHGGALHAALCCASLGNDPADVELSGGGSLEAVRLLLQYGADPNEADAEGRTAASHAASLPEHLRLLLDAGANVARADKKGNDALYWAVGLASTQSVALLLNAGAPVDRVYERGTALDIARSRTGAEGTVALLLEHGAKPGAQSAAGREAIRRTKAKKQEQKDRENQRMADTDAARPDLRKPAKSARYAKAIARLAAITGQPTEQVEPVPGLVVSRAGKADQLLEQYRSEFGKFGAFLFMYEMPAAVGAGTCMAILPTKDPLIAMAALSWGGANQDLSLREIIDGLREVAEKHAPYVIDRISGDTIEGRFTGPIRTPRKLAEVLYRICPDIVDQGTETVAALAKELRKTKRLFLWWD